MRIARGEIEFDAYEVFVRKILRPTPLDRLLSIEREELVPVKNVLEADDETGQLTVQLADELGNLLYTNGADDIAIDNPVKLLMLLPQVRAIFMESGFVPKIQTTYEKLLLRKRT